MNTLFDYLIEQVGRQRAEEIVHEAMEETFTVAVKDKISIKDWLGENQ